MLPTLIDFHPKKFGTKTLLLVFFFFPSQTSLLLFGLHTYMQACMLQFTNFSSCSNLASIGDSNFSIYAGDYSCTAEVHRALPILKKAYGDSMHKVLHVGPDTCSVVSKLLKEEETVAWGVEPYDIEDADSSCRALVHKGIVRVADIKFPLPYRPKSFSLVIISDALDYLSPRYLNKTLPDLARVSADGLVVFTGNNLKRAYPLFRMDVVYIHTF